MQELEADDRATTWMKGSHAAEPARQFGARPASSGMELERHALVMLVGMIWVAQFELGPHGKSATHPDGVTRMNAMVERRALAPDSFAAEIRSYLVKVLIVPDGHWPVDLESPYAIDAATDAMTRLNRCINAG
jgi:hypothetical protein